MADEGACDDKGNEVEEEDAGDEAQFDEAAVLSLGLDGTDDAEARGEDPIDGEEALEGTNVVAEDEAVAQIVVVLAAPQTTPRPHHSGAGDLLFFVAGLEFGREAGPVHKVEEIACGERGGGDEEEAGDDPEGDVGAVDDDLERVHRDDGAEVADGEEHERGEAHAGECVGERLGGNARIAARGEHAEGNEQMDCEKSGHEDGVENRGAKISSELLNCSNLGVEWIFGNWNIFLRRDAPCRLAADLEHGQANTLGGEGGASDCRGQAHDDGVAATDVFGDCFESSCRRFDEEGVVLVVGIRGRAGVVEAELREDETHCFSNRGL